VSSGKSLLLSVARALMGRGLGAAGQLIVTIALALLFGADGSGSLMLGLTFMIMLSLVGRRGLDFAMLRIASEAWGDNDRPRYWAAVQDASKHAAISSLAIALLLGLATPLLARFVFDDPALLQILPWCAAAIPAYAMLSLWSESHKAIDRPGMGNFYHTGIVPLSFAVLLGLMKVSGQESLLLAAIGYMTATYLAATVAYFSLRRFAGPVTRHAASELPTMRRAGVPLLIFGLFTMAGNWLPLVTLGIFAQPDQVGQFGAAARLAILIMFILLAFNSVTPARFARLHAAGDLRGISRLARNTSVLMTLVALPLTLAMGLFGSWILGWMGDDFSPAAPALAILAVGQLINVATGSVGYILIMTGHETQLRQAGTAGFVVNLVGCLLLVPNGGVTGAACAAALAIATENLTATWLAYRTTGVVSLPWPAWSTPEESAAAVHAAPVLVQPNRGDRRG